MLGCVQLLRFRLPGFGTTFKIERGPCRLYAMMFYHSPQVLDFPERNRLAACDRLPASGLNRKLRP